MYDYEFVDSIASAPTVRLSLTRPYRVLTGTDFGPPQLRRAVASTLLTDGERYPAAAYANRLITLIIEIEADGDDAASALQSLWRELDRPTNVLRYRPGTTDPVHFRTHRAGPDSIQWDPVSRRVTCNIPAEPFAYGLRETLDAVTVTNDPAAGSNGMYFDVSGVRGDVETPLYTRFTSGIPTVALNSNRRVSAISVRRRGDVSEVPFFAQAESFSMQSADTTVQVNNASFSGSGSNWVRCTFATTASHAYRMALNNFPTALPLVGARGLYRVFLRYRWSATGTTGTMALRWGLGAQITNDTVTLPATVAAGTPFCWADLGLMQIPAGYDPVVDGIAGAEIDVGPTTLDIFAGRTGGAGSLDMDVITLMPADDRTLRVRWPYATFTPDEMVLDASVPALYGTDANGSLMSQAGAEMDGLPPMVSPGVTNRIFLMRSVTPDPAIGSTPVSDAITDTTDITPYYWPRYLYVAAVGS